MIYRVVIHSNWTNFYTPTMHYYMSKGVLEWRHLFESIAIRNFIMQLNVFAFVFGLVYLIGYESYTYFFPEICWVLNSVWCMGLIQMFTKSNKYIKHTKWLIEYINHSNLVPLVVVWCVSGDILQKSLFYRPDDILSNENRRLRLNHNLLFTMKTKSPLGSTFSVIQSIHSMQICLYIWW